MRVKLAIMTRWMTRTALCIALLMSAAAPVRADEATKDAPPPAAGTVYDETQPGADDPRVREGNSAAAEGDFKKAYDIWLPLANAGNADAQFRIGTLFDLDGFDGGNVDAAIRWYRAASEQNHLSAIYNLGLLFDYDKRVPRDIEQARFYYSKGANLCDSNSQYRLGALILRMPKSERDNVEGHKWLEIAAAFGQQRAAEASKKLVGLITVPTEYETAKKKAQEWLENHPCGKLLD